MSHQLVTLVLIAIFLAVGCSDRGQLRIEHAWLALAAQGAEVTGFLEIENPGKEAVEIVSAASENFESVTFYLRDGSEYRAVQSLTVPARGRLVLDGESGRLGFNAAKHELKDGDHLPFAVAVRLLNGQLMTLETELHVHKDQTSASHEHEHH